jgi:hypothetical protein
VCSSDLPSGSPVSGANKDKELEKMRQERERLFRLKEAIEKKKIEDTKKQVEEIRKQEEKKKREEIMKKIEEEKKRQKRREDIKRLFPNKLPIYKPPLSEPINRPKSNLRAVNPVSQPMDNNERINQIKANLDKQLAILKEDRRLIEAQSKEEVKLHNQSEDRELKEETKERKRWKDISLFRKVKHKSPHNLPPETDRIPHTPIEKINEVEDDSKEKVIKDKAKEEREINDYILMRKEMEKLVDIKTPNEDLTEYYAEMEKLAQENNDNREDVKGLEEIEEVKQIHEVILVSTKEEDKILLKTYLEEQFGKENVKEVINRLNKLVTITLSIEQ